MLADSQIYLTPDYVPGTGSARFYQLYQQWVQSDLGGMRLKTHETNEPLRTSSDTNTTGFGTSLPAAEMDTTPASFSTIPNLLYANLFDGTRDRQPAMFVPQPMQGIGTNRSSFEQPTPASLIATLAEHMLALTKSTQSSGIWPLSPIFCPNTNTNDNHSTTTTNNNNNSSNAMKVTPTEKYSPTGVSTLSERDRGGRQTYMPSKPLPSWSDLINPTPNNQHRNNTVNNMSSSSQDTTGSPQIAPSPFGSNGCIDLSLANRRNQPHPEPLHPSNCPNPALFLSTMTSPDESTVRKNLVSLSRVSTPVQRTNYASLSPMQPVKLDPLDTHIQFRTNSIESIASHRLSSDGAADHPISSASLTSGQAHTVRAKHRKSGFQAGVTVGYTYDAFFVSDGRSRRRGKGKTQTQHKRSSNARSRNESGLMSLSSSSSQSASSSNTSSTGLLRDSSSEVTPVQPISSYTSQLLIAASLSPAPDQPTQRYSCPDCGKSYATSSNLSRHKQTHRSLDSQAARKCPHCGKTYVSMPALSMHILTHDLKHRCDLCGKAFSRPWLLQGHRRAHTGEKPYGCAHCGRAFADRSNLRAHMQTHSGMKQYECKRCHKNFALKSYLNKHLESACLDKSDSLDASGSPTGSHSSHRFTMKTECSPNTTGIVQETRPISTVAWSVTQLIDN